MSAIIDILIHAWVIYDLVIGVISGTKLKKLPDEPEVSIEAGAVPAEVAVPAEGTVPEDLPDGQPQE